MEEPISWLLDTYEPLTAFLWAQFTPNVRAGRRIPVERKQDGTLWTKPLDGPEAMFVEGITLEGVTPDGERVGLIVTDMTQWINPGQRGVMSYRLKDINGQTLVFG